MKAADDILAELERGAATSRELSEVTRHSQEQIQCALLRLRQQGKVISVPINRNKNRYHLKRRSFAAMIPWLRSSGMELVRELEAGGLEN